MDTGKPNSTADSQKACTPQTEELREKLFQLVFDKADFGITITDRQGKFLDVNPAMERLLGYSPAEMRKVDFGQITHTNDRAESLNWFNELMAGKIGAYRLTKRYLHRDGQVIWVNLVVSSEPSLEGPPLFSIGMVEDITEEKASVETLQKNAEQYRLLAENVSDVIWTSDLNQRVTYISPSYRSLTGLDPEEAIGRSIEQILPATAAESCWKYLAGQLALDQTSPDPSRRWTLEVELLRRDGTKVWTETKKSFLRDSQGKPNGILAVTRDITAHKNLEKQLFQAQKMEVITRLARGAAHDFNNFLTVVMAYTDVILNDFPTGHPLQHYAQEILLAAERASSLTRQLLAFSHKQVIQPQILNLNHLITVLEKLLRRLIPEDIELKISLDPQLEKIKADPGQIEQVLMDLVINAGDALPHGGKILIRTDAVYLDQLYGLSHPGVESGFYVRLTLSDNGVGMDQDTLEHIFEPFFSTKEQHRGTGLGLATVHGIVKQHNGHITVSSNLGEGTTFEVYLPRIREAEKPIQAQTLEEPQCHGTILLAEDERLLLKVISKALQSYGFRVLEARDGKEGLQIGREFQEPIDLLLADVVMPGMCGSELANRLKKSHPEMRVAFMSGHVEDALLRHKILDGDALFIQKPSRTINLVRRVQEILRPARGVEAFRQPERASVRKWATLPIHEWLFSAMANSNLKRIILRLKN